MSDFVDLAFAAGTLFSDRGIVAILVGGGAATFYAPEAYQTRDLDFVFQFGLTGLRQADLASIGFSETKTRGVFAHPELPFTLNCLEGPIAIGDELLHGWAIQTRGSQTLNVLHPIDCVRDRLAAAIYWNDLSSIRQAAAVANHQAIDHDAIRSWCEREASPRTFELFRRYLAL